MHLISPCYRLTISIAQLGRAIAPTSSFFALPHHAGLQIGLSPSCLLHQTVRSSIQEGDVADMLGDRRVCSGFALWRQVLNPASIGCHRRGLDQLARPQPTQHRPQAASLQATQARPSLATRADKRPVDPSPPSSPQPSLWPPNHLPPQPRQHRLLVGATGLRRQVAVEAARTAGCCTPPCPSTSGC